MMPIGRQARGKDVTQDMYYFTAYEDNPDPDISVHLFHLL